MASVSAARKPTSDDEWVDVAPPTPVASVEDEWVDADQWVDAAPTPAGQTVADTARTRLSRRGLTLEKIKADPSLSITRPGQIRQRSPKTTDRGFLGELGGSLNPVEIAGSLASDWGRGLLSAVATPFLQSDDPSVDPADNYQPHVPQLVPDLPAIYQEATRRGEQGESLAGMYGSATGQVLLAGSGALTSKLIRGAPARAAAAEAQYAEATGATPPVAREMLNRRMVIGADPTPQAAAQRAQAATINAERSAIPAARPVRGARGRFQQSTDLTDIANSARRADLKSQAQMESDIAAILEATPETRTTLGAVGKGAGRFAKSRLTLASGLLGAGAGWSPASLVSLGPVAVTHLLWSISKELVKTNQWQTAAPIYKMRFANALMTGNADVAAATGALIASGKAVGTESVSGPSSASVDSRRE